MMKYSIVLIIILWSTQISIGQTQEKQTDTNSLILKKTSFDIQLNNFSRLQTQFQTVKTYDNSASIKLPTFKSNLQIYLNPQSDIMIRTQSLYPNSTNHIDFDNKGNMRIIEYNVPGLKYHPRMVGDCSNSLEIDFSMLKRNR